MRQVEAYPDAAFRQTTLDLVRALMDFHASGIERMLEIAWESGETGRAMIDRYGSDAIVEGLLLLYGLHPVDVETRVRHALERVRPAVASHGGTVELEEVRGTVVRVRLGGSCEGCPSSAVTLTETVEKAIYEAAPEVEAVECEVPGQSRPEELIRTRGGMSR